MRKERNRRRVDTGSSWISYSDMMAALLLLFVLVLCYSMFQFLSALESKTAQLDEQAALLSEQELQLGDQETRLLALQEELDGKQLILISLEEELDLQKQQLSEQESQLAVIRIELGDKEKLLAEQQEELDASKLVLVNKESELAAAQSKLKEQQDLLSAQQKKLDDLVGVRTQIVRELTASLASSSINASVDPDTGDIMLESAVFFGYGKNTLTASGQEFLRKFIPVYLNVLLKEENLDYLGEIIIEGHTDSTGTYLANLELSQQRALAVAKFCLQMPELSSEQRELLQNILTATGKSYSELIYNDDGTENAEASRRVEFKFRLKDTEMIDEIREILSEDEDVVE